jgi:uncharacterized protein YjbJ (UPF0337 family)
VYVLGGHALEEGVTNGNSHHDPGGAGHHRLGAVHRPAPLTTDMATQARPMRRAHLNERTWSMATDSGAAAGAKGIVEDIKGKVKEVAGEVSGDESLEAEGRAQQDKASAQRDVAEHEAKAEAARSEAQLHEAEQRLHQDD